MPASGPDVNPTSVLDSLTDVVFLTDPAGNWTYLNPAWTAITGFSVPASMGTNFLDYVHPDEQDHARALFMAVVAGGSDHCHHQARYRTSDGSYRWVQLRAQLLFDDAGALIGNSGTLADITELRLAEETVGEHGDVLELSARGVTLERLPVGIMVFSPDLTLRTASASVAAQLGGAAAVGAPITRLFELLSTPGRRSALDGEWGLVATARRTGHPQYAEVQEARDPAGRRLTYQVSVLPLPERSADGPAVALVTHDVTSLRRLHRQQAAVAALGQRGLEGLAVGRLLDEAVTAVAATLETPHCEVLELLPGTDGLQPRATFGSPLGAGGDLVSSLSVAIDGEPGRSFGVLAVHTTHVRSYSPDEVDFLRSVANVLAAAIGRSKAETQIRRHALHDPLTGLANRVLLHDRLEHALRARRRDGSSVALLLIDLDRFRDVNEELGRDVGDTVLGVVADRLRNGAPPEGTVARLGSDEFAVVLPNVGGAAAAVQVADQLRARVVEPTEHNGVVLRLEASVGLVTAPAHGQAPTELLKRADVALQRAKTVPSGVTVYNLASDGAQPERLASFASLRHAIDDAQLVLHYQPKVDLTSGRTTAVEALVRWQHPTRGLVLPDLFIPLAEATGLIKPLTWWALSTAMAQSRRWLDAGRRLPVAVNISAGVLHDADLVGFVESELRRHDLPSQALQLEVTESATMTSPDRAMTVITRLREHGVRLSLDDFGTGYSSLAYLRNLPVHELKIDRSFVRDLREPSKDASIVRSVIELGHNLGLRVVGEGIESRDVHDLLRDLGCDEGQGHYFSPAVAAGDLVLPRAGHDADAGAW